MIIYLFYLIILICLLYCEKYSNRKVIYRTIIPILFALFVGLRGENVGVDTENYYEHFYKYGAYGCFFVEKGFDWINRWLYANNYSASTFLLVLASISVCFIALSIRKKQGNEYTISAFCLYLLTFSYLINGVRQGIAASILLFSVEFIQKRKLLPFVALLLLGSLFHVSVLLLAPLYFICHYNLKDSIYVIIYVLSFAGLFVDFSQYIPSIVFLGRDYSRYVDNIRIEPASSLGYIVTTTLYVLVLILMLKNEMFRKHPVISNLTFIYFVLRNLSFSLPIVIGRLAGYFPWFMFFVYSVMINKKMKGLFGDYYITVVVLLAIHLVLWLHSLISPDNMQIPYTFYWETNSLY